MRDTWEYLADRWESDSHWRSQIVLAAIVAIIGVIGVIGETLVRRAGQAAAAGVSA